MSADWVKIGAKCVCIDREWHKPPATNYITQYFLDNAPIPVFMQTYTIMGINSWKPELHGKVGLQMEELYFTSTIMGTIYPWYSLRNLRGNLCWAPLEDLPDEVVEREVELT